MQSPQLTNNQTKVLRANSLLEDYLQQQQKQLYATKRTTHLLHQPINKHSIGLETSRDQDSQSNPYLADNQTSNLYSDQLPSIVRIQRKLLAFFYIYATLIVSLYLTYAIYCYYQHTSSTKTPTLGPKSTSANKEQRQVTAEQLSAQQSNSLGEEPSNLEQKLQLLERYIEVIALDLEETKGRLREREKCACSMNCLFNGTLFSDGQKWQQKCDTCACQGGKITCSPRVCPKLSCENPVQLAGQCCPTCMKNCKLKKSIIKHGQVVKSNEGSKKQCKCNDGVIRCEPLKSASLQEQQVASGRKIDSKAQDKTLEYLSSIIAATPRLLVDKPKL